MQVKTLERARRDWSFKTDASSVWDQCTKTPLPADELKKALDAVFGERDWGIEVEDEDEDFRGLTVEDYVLRPDAVVVDALGGPRVYSGWVLERAVYDPGSRESPPDMDYTDLVACRSWSEVLRALVTDMARESLEAYLESIIDYSEMEIPEIPTTVEDMLKLPVLKIPGDS